MTAEKSKAILNIETHMQALSPESFRYQALDAARRFKSSWIELGQHLYSISRDKLYKAWGYLTFEAYCAKEIGIRQHTAVKLLKSYGFLEREEPAFLKRKFIGENKPSAIPGYESVNALRLAKESKKIDSGEYESLREEVLDHPGEDAEVKKKIRYLLKSHSAPVPREDQRKTLVSRLTVYVETAIGEAEKADLPSKITKKMEELHAALRDYQKTLLEEP